MIITNLYLVPNYKNLNGGRFYNIYKNQGAKLDLSGLVDLDNIDSLEEKVHTVTGDTTFKRIGGVITKVSEQIESTNVYNDFSTGEHISPESKKNYEQLLHNLELISRIQEENKELVDKIRSSEKGHAKVLKR